MPPTYGRAGAFSVLLMLVVAATLYLYFRVTREGDKFHTVTGKGYRPTVIQLSSRRYVTTALLLLLYPSCSSCCRFSLFSGPRYCLSICSLSLEAFSLFTLKNFVTAIYLSEDYGFHQEQRLCWASAAPLW